MSKPVIGAGISLDGESKFKSALSGINSDLKVLTSEMKKVTSEFLGNENSVEALAAKDRVLSDQVEKQTGKIELLKAALESANSQYGENDERTKKWQISLNRAETDLNKLNSEIKLNKDEMNKAQKPTEDMAKDVKTFGDHAETAGKQAFTMGDMIKANLISQAIIGGVKLLASAIKGAGQAAFDSAKEAAAYSDEILTLNAQTGIATDTLQELKYMEELTDVSLETVTKSMAKNIKSMKDVQDGTKLSVEAYKQLGVEVLNTDGSMRDGQTVYWEVVDALGKMQNETQRDALAMTILGKSAQDLNPLIEIGSNGMNKFAQEAKDMGAVLSEEALGSLGKYDDALQRLDKSTDILSRTFGGIFAPILTEVATLATNYMADFSKQVEAANGDAGKIGTVIGSTLSDIVTKIVENLPQIIDAAKGIIEALIGGIKQNLPEIVKTGMEIIVDLATTLIEMLPEIVKIGLDIIVQLANGIADSLPTLIPVIVDTVLTIVDTLINNVDQLVDAAIAIMMGLADGMITALPALIDKLPVIIDKLIIAITNNLPKLIEMILYLNIEMAKGMIKAIPQLISKIPEIVTSIVNGFKNFYPKLGEVGLNLIQGIWQGIKDAAAWLKEKIAGFASGIVDSIKDFFGIHSPSTLFRDGIGRNLALGIGAGFSSEMKSVASKMNASIPTSFDANINMSGYSGGYGHFTSNIFLDSVVVASATSKTQYRKNQSYERSFGVIPV